MAFSDTLSNLMSTIKKFVYDKTSADAKFVKYTDLPTTLQAGPVKAGNWLSIDDGSTNANDRGKMKCGELTLAQYNSCKGYTFISKTTLENALGGKGYLTSSSLNGYAKTSDIPSLTNYALKTDIPDVSGFITETQLNSKGYLTSSSLNGYAKTTDIPDVSNFITASALTGYAKTSDIPSLTDYAKKTDIPSLSGYATQTWVEGKGYITSSALTGYAKTTDIPSLTDYAKKTDIPSLTNYYTKSEIDAMLVDGDEVGY